MFNKSIIIHLRLPFSLFLSPVFLFALSHAPQDVQKIDLFNVILTFIVLHLFLYPASNAYNTYFDKDEDSIGGIKYPPKVTRDLYLAAILFDAVGIFLAFWVSIWFAILIFIYGLVSKAYSHPKIRLKRHPFISWLTVGLFQGGFIYLACTHAFYKTSFYETIFDVWLKPNVYLPASLATLLLLSSYPMTQIYQHQQDKKNGDLTISLLIGIKGTFYITGVMLAIVVIGFEFFYYQYYSTKQFHLFLVFLSPLFIYFWFWLFMVIKDQKNANFNHTMVFNGIFSLCMITYFLFFMLGDWIQA